MKQIGPWIFLILYIIALAKPLAPLLEYQANRDFFAEVLCINKSKPELNCNGNCALTQKLKQAQENETQPVSAPGTIKLDDYPIGFVLLYRNPIKFNRHISTLFTDTTIEIVVQGYFSEIFRPPCLV